MMSTWLEACPVQVWPLPSVTVTVRPSRLGTYTSVLREQLQARFLLNSSMGNTPSEGQVT